VWSGAACFGLARQGAVRLATQLVSVSGSPQTPPTHAPHPIAGTCAGRKSGRHLVATTCSEAERVNTPPRSPLIVTLASSANAVTISARLAVVTDAMTLAGHDTSRAPQRLRPASRQARRRSVDGRRHWASVARRRVAVDGRGDTPMDERKSNCSARARVDTPRVRTNDVHHDQRASAAHRSCVRSSAAHGQWRATSVGLVALVSFDRGKA
jgi:hypothetical protein